MRRREGGQTIVLTIILSESRIIEFVRVFQMERIHYLHILVRNEQSDYYKF